jgi:hypothetical protein
VRRKREKTYIATVKHEHYSLSYLLEIAAGRNDQLAQRAIETCLGCQENWRCALASLAGKGPLLGILISIGIDFT